MVFCISCNCYSNLAHKYLKIFSFIAPVDLFKGLEVNFFSAYLFQECQEKCSSAIIEVNIDLLSFFHKKRARARTFVQIPSKPKNACNIHNSEFACKKSASYDNSKVCLTTV